MLITITEFSVTWAWAFWDRGGLVLKVGQSWGSWDGSSSQKLPEDRWEHQWTKKFVLIASSQWQFQLCVMEKQALFLSLMPRALVLFPPVVLRIKDPSQIWLRLMHKYPHAASLLIIQRRLWIEKDFSSRSSDGLVPSRWCFPQPLRQAKPHGHGVMNCIHPGWTDLIKHEELFTKGDYTVNQMGAGSLTFHRSQIKNNRLLFANLHGRWWEREDLGWVSVNGLIL